jgi:hypothetical protein
MRNYLFIALLIVASLLIQSNTKPKILYSTYDDHWSGNISFSQIIYDTVHGTHYCGWDNDTSWSEWRMEASVINNSATTKSSLNGWRRGAGYDTCMAAWGAIKDTTFAEGNASAELELDIYQGEYGFTVDIPSCAGKTISKRYRNFVLTNTIVDDTSEGDSQILVEKQKVGSNPNVLSGKIELHDRQQGRDFIQIWKWNLKKVK